MSGPPSPPPNPEWLDALLDLPGLEAQIEYLERSGGLDAENLGLLLEQAMRLARSDPGRARRLAALCAGAAARAGSPALGPRALYVSAQTHLINGEFEEALERIQAAREQYESLGETLEALRTQIGRMWALNELGRHAEALEAGESVLAALQGREDSDEARLVATLARHNLGIVYETTGRYAGALERYAEAEAGYSRLGMRERLGDVSNNRGIVLVHLGRVSEALEAFERASRILGEAGQTLLQAQTLSNTADAHLAQGNYALALEAFEAAGRLLENLDAQANKGILLRKTADAYLALNLYPESEALYREAAGFLRTAGMADHLARALAGLGAVLLAESRLGEAGPVLAEAGALFEAAGNLPMLSAVLLEESALLWARGDLEAARLRAGRALALVEAGAWPVQRIFALLRLADLQLPDTETAEALLEEAGRLAGPLALPALDYRLNSRLGRVRLLQGRLEEAEAYLTAAAQQIENLRGKLAHLAVRASFLADKTPVFDDLLQLYLEQDDPVSLQRAFQTAERARSRALVELLTGLVPRNGQAEADPELEARLQSLQADLSAVYNRFLEAAGPAGAEGLASLQARAAGLEQEISRLRLRLSSQAASPLPGAASLVELEALQAGLAEDLGLLAYYTLGEEVLVFLIRRHDAQVVRRVGCLPVVRSLLERLNAQWERFRAGEGFWKRNLPRLEKTARRLLSALYQELFAALEEPLRAAAGGAPARLVVVPHGILHGVPFHALYDGERSLIERFEFSYAHSAALYALARPDASWERSGALVVSQADALIPAVGEEGRRAARELARAGYQVELLEGEQATLARLQAGAPGRQVLHLACHGLFRADNPFFSALKLADGWLTAAEALHLPLDGARVVLSACESGRSRVLGGDDVIGLPRAFLGAGAVAVVVSLWLVPDETTAGIMADLYRELGAGAGLATALRRVQLELAARRPHPYFWAPFVLIGRR